MGGPFGVNPRQTYTFAISGGSAVTLTVGGVAGNLRWTGGNNATWDTGTSQNWFNTTSGSADYFFAGDKTTFNDTPGTANIVTISGTVLPGSVTVSNTNVNYTFGGTGSIGGATSLAKSGPGTLSIATSNVYTGGTTLSGGVLNANAVSALGSGTLGINGGTLNANYAQSPTSVTLSGGLLNLGNSGALGSGTLAIGAATFNNTSGGPLGLAGNNPQAWNGDFTFIGTQSLNLGSGAVVLGSNRIVTVNANTLTVSGPISDGGAGYGLNSSGSGVLVLGGSLGYAGNTTVSGGTLQLTAAAVGSLSSGTTTVNSGAVLQWNPTAVATLAGSTSYAGGGVIQMIGGNRLAIGNNGPVTANLSAGGVLDVEAGDLNIGYSHQFQGSNLGGLNIAAGASYHTSDNSLQEDWLTGSGSLNNGFNNTTPVLYLGAANTANNAAYGVANNTATFSGALGYPENYAGNGGVTVNSLSLVKEGNGTQVLAGYTGYTGTTLVSGGTLQLSGSNTLSHYASSTTTVNSGAVLQWNTPTNAPTMTGNTAYTGAGVIVKTGAGYLGNGNQAVTANLAAGGVLDIEQGDMNIGGSHQFQGSNLGGMNVAAGASFHISDASFQEDWLTGAGSLNNAYNNSTPILYIGAANTTNNAAYGVANNTATFYGVIGYPQNYGGTVVNSLSVVKEGAGTQILAASNGYSLSTTITGGTLQLGTGLINQDGSINSTSGVTDKAALVYDIYGTQTPGYAISGSGSVAYVGPGLVIQSGNNNNYTGGTYLGGGGTLQLSNANALGNAAGALTVNSGLLNLNGYSVTAPGISGTGGSVYSPSPATLTLTPAMSKTYGGGIGGATSVTLNAPVAAQTIAGTSTYTGATTVTAGTLSFTGGTSLSTSPYISIASGAVLDVSQLAGGLSMSGGTLNAGRASAPATDVNGRVTLLNSLATVAGGAAGTMTIGGNLSLTGGSLSYVPGDLVNATGALTLGGVDYVVPTLALSSTTYTLFTYNGSLTGGTADLAMAGIYGSNPRQSYTFGISSGSAVTLSVTGLAGSLTWNGGSNSTWNTGISKNWYNLSTSAADYFYTGDNVTFNDTPGTATNVTISCGSLGSVQPGSLTVSNTAVNYTFNGDPIAGVTSLVKNGSGSLTLISANSYSGGTFVNAGTVNANAATALGSGSIAVSGGALSANAVNALGSGRLVQSGGVVTLGYAQSVNSVALSGGLMIVNDPAALGSGPLTLSGGSLDNQSGSPITLANNNPMAWNSSFAFLGSSPLNTGTGAVTLGTTPTVTVGGSGALTVGGVISGPGFGLALNGSGILDLTAANTYSDVTAINGGTLQMGSAAAFTTTPGTYSIASGATLSLDAGAATNYNPAAGITEIRGGGTFQVSSGSLNAQGFNRNVLFLMNGGAVINVAPGATFVQGNYGSSLWTSGGSTNLASLNVNGTFDTWNGNNVYVDALAGNGNIIHGYGGAVGDNGGSGTFGGTITDSPAVGGLTSLTKSGSGIETLSGGNTSYGGGTTVSGGTLVLSDLPNLYAGASNGYLTGGGVALQNNSTLLVNTNNSQMQFIDTTLSGLGTLVKTGGNNLLLGYNGYTTYISFAAGSLVDVEGGLLRNEYGNGDWTNNQASMYVAAGASVDLWDSPGGITVDALNGGGTVQHTSYGGSENLTIGVANGSGTFSGTLTDAVGLGTGPQVLNLVKNGTGTEVLGSLTSIATATSTFTGNVTVNGGTLIGAAQSNGAATSFGYASNSRTITVNAGATLQFDAPNTFGQFYATSTVPTLYITGGMVTNADPVGQMFGAHLVNNPLNNVIMSSGTLTAMAGENGPGGSYGAWNINGQITSTGNSLISTSEPVYGAVMLSNGGAALGATTFNVASGILTVSAPLIQDNVDGNVSGLILTGSGTLLLSGTNTYSGGTTINSGTLAVTNPASLGDPSGVLTVGPGTLEVSSSFSDARNIVLNDPAATIQVDPSVIYGNSGAISGTGALNLTGEGTLILSGSNTFSGGTLVDAGTLVIDVTTALPDGSSLFVGQGASSDFSFAPVVSAATPADAGVVVVPEPGTLWLLAAALWSAMVCHRFAKRGRIRDKAYLAEY
jgi:fibronectin-binding autotransporter adhesin